MISIQSTVKKVKGSLVLTLSTYDADKKEFESHLIIDDVELPLIKIVNDDFDKIKYDINGIFSNITTILLSNHYNISMYELNKLTVKHCNYDVLGSKRLFDYNYDFPQSGNDKVLNMRIHETRYKKWFRVKSAYHLEFKYGDDILLTKQFKSFDDITELLYCFTLNQSIVLDTLPKFCMNYFENQLIGNGK